MEWPNTYLRTASVLPLMAEKERKWKTAEEIAAVTGGDADPIKRAFSGVRIIQIDEDEE